MSKLERWLPFMFKKKTQQEPQPATETQALSQPVQHHPMAPFAHMFSPQMQQLMRGFFNDPFFREPFGRFGQMERWFGDFSPNRFSPARNARPHRSHRFREGAEYDSLFESRRTTP